MARATFRCSKCSRSFGMAAHLARHMTTIHSRGGRKMKKKGRIGRPKGSKNRGSGMARRVSVGSAAGAPADLLRQMQGYHDQLAAESDSLAAKMGNIADAIRALGAPAPVRAGAKRRGRPPGRPASALSPEGCDSVHGPPGRVQGSALSVQWARRYRRRYPDRQSYSGRGREHGWRLCQHASDAD